MTDKEMVIHLAKRVGYKVIQDKIDQWHYPYYMTLFEGPTTISIGLHSGQLDYKFDGEGKLIEMTSRAD